jgi:5'-nucleotidase
VFGNHEFDFGPDILKARMAESRFSWLGANVRLKSNNALFANTLASEIRVFDGVKVGFLGVVTASTATSSRPGPDLRFEDANFEARREAGRLRTKGAVVVVALTHQDLAQDRKLAETGAVDIILGGHDHVPMQSLTGRTPIFKAGSDSRLAARVDLFIDKDSRRLTHSDWEMLPVDTALPEDPDTAKVVAGYEAKLSVLLDMPVGESSVLLDARQEANRSRETGLGNWLADIYRTRTGADVAIVNGGSIRSDATYGPGKLSKRDILSILPFENPIVKLDVSGKTLRAALEHGLSQIHESKESGRFPQVSGLGYVYDARQPVGKRLTQVTVAGVPLDDQRRYSLALAAYLAKGGDGYEMLKGQPFLISPENALSEIAEAIEALAAGSPIAPKVEGRIAVSK